jgi:hypothetical protein
VKSDDQTLPRTLSGLGVANGCNIAILTSRNLATEDLGIKL